MIIVSACLLGLRCRYDGAAFPHERAIELMRKNVVIPVCPEQLGGLPTPRIPCELRDGRVFGKDGIDRTEFFAKGVEEALYLMELGEIHGALLKDKSPTCGSSLVYDGTFSGVLRPGRGLFASALMEKNIKVYSDLNYNLEFDGMTRWRV